MIWAALIAFFFGPTCGFVFALVCGPVLGWACALSLTGREAEVDRVVLSAIAWVTRSATRLRPRRPALLLDDDDLELDLDVEGTGPIKAA